MKILIADVLLKDKPHSDWKEGWEFYYAFKNLGYECEIAGKNCPIPETEIPNIANKFDLVIITENYPRHHSGWSWWNWKSINTKKLFWAIDTHLINYNNWISNDKIDYVAFNNLSDMKKYQIKNSFWMPYAASSIHHCKQYTDIKDKDAVFIGGITDDRKKICDKFGIQHINAFGEDYIRQMQSAKICFNKSISYDINAKYFEILGSGTFMLTNYNENFFNFVDRNPFIEKMFYHSEDREYIASEAKRYVYENHTYEQRAKLILDSIK
jgi:hypothetical protein